MPSRLAVDDCGVTEAGPAEQIESLCSNVQELDMAKNRVTDWLQVLPINSFQASVNGNSLDTDLAWHNIMPVNNLDLNC